MFSPPSKTLVLWSIVSLDPTQNFVELFQSLQAWKLSIVKMTKELSAVVLGPSGVSVFGRFIKFTVSLDEPGSILDVSKHVFEIMMQGIYFLPDPLMGFACHCIPCSDVYGTDTSKKE